MGTNSKEYMRDWRQRHPGKMREYDQKWRAANPEVAKESDLAKYRRSYAKKRQDPVYMAQSVVRTKRWMKNNPEHSRLLRLGADHRRRARKHSTSVGPVDYKLVLVSSDGLCGICKRPLEEEFEYDHIIPLAKGGSHTEDNLQLAHPYCNRHKNARLDYRPED